MGESSKICVICGEDCSNRPRIKDPKGRYYHKDCHERAKRAQEARRATVATDPSPPAADEPEDLGFLSELLDEEAARPPGAQCPSCGQALAPEDVICTRCGFSVDSGRSLKVKIKKDKAPRQGGARFEGVPAILLSPFGVSMMALAILGLLFGLVLATGRPSAALAFVAFANLLIVTSSIVVLVVAFMEGFAQGLLTLCIPLYVFYFLFVVSDNQWARWFFVVSVITRGAGAFLVAYYS